MDLLNFKIIFFAQVVLSSDEMRHADMKMSNLNMKIIHILFTKVSVCVCVFVLHLREAKSQITMQTEPPHLILMLIVRFKC